MEFYYHEVDGDVLILKADGGLNAHESEEFVTKIGKLVEAGLTKMIVDCSPLEFISSAGMAMLIRVHRRMRDRGGNVKLAGLKGGAFDVIHLTHLDKVFEIYGDVDQARLAFR